MLFTLNAVATEFKIIDLQHRFADDILPIIQPLAGSDGAITGMQNHLIIRVSPQRMVEIEEVISRLDVARQNLKISVSQQNSQQLESSGVAVSGRKRIANVEISTNKYPRNGNGNGNIQLNVKKNQSNTQHTSNRFINVLDGEPAFIRVGQSIPFTQEWLVLTQRYIHVQKITEFVDISTGFAVRPRSIGEQIELEITPRIAQLNQQGYIDFEELSTVVRIKKGEWLNLGGIMQEKDEVSRTILSQQNGAQSASNSLSIRVD